MALQGQPQEVARSSSSLAVRNLRVGCKFGRPIVRTRHDPAVALGDVGPGEFPGRS